MNRLFNYFIVALFALGFSSCLSESDVRRIDAATSNSLFDELEEIDEEFDNESAATIVEKMPEFPGGEEALLVFIATEIQYPPMAVKHGIYGRVFVQFTVESDGSLTDIKILRGIGAGCDEEAIRVVESMPKWIPAMVYDIPVAVQMNLPIYFEKQEQNRIG